ncbi:hypothetical protein [Pseudomonas sp. RA_35y_Pfl2_P32]|uniref:hypothetical protein n=1 Tax=Pseudomonas sp. RA_35y_Pfl2_P32 TaxID=3088705 RepID=UPI0030DB5B3B
MDEREGPSAAVVRMSREFLSADDAARHAHEQVGKRRDREFVAMIFQCSNQRFVVTEPVDAGTDALEAPPLFPVDAQGRAIYPLNHQLHSVFYSHQALSTLDVDQVQRLGWTRTDACVSLQMFKVHELFHVVAQGVPAYLSGSDDSLLWFEPDTRGWQQLLMRLGTVSRPGPLARGLADGSIAPVEFVRAVASAGKLQILVDNGLWGYRGQVTKDWTPHPEQGARPVPKQVAFGAVFSSADEAAQDCFSRGAEQHDTERTWFGFILKQQGKHEYIASELVAVEGVRDKLFSRRSLFPSAGPGEGRDFVYPESFQRHSYFYSRQRVTQAQRPSRLWLAQHFIVPRDLYVVVYDSKRPPVEEGVESIPTYIATQDGALLKYVARKSTKLFDNDTPEMGLEAIQSNLANGKLTQTGFVRVVANSGELTVLHTTLCWDREGVVNAQWTPAQNLERRLLGPVFPTLDDAALHARAQVPRITDRVYGGLVLKRADGLFVATLPVITPEEDFDVKWIFPDESVSAGLFPAGCTIVARYRSRHAQEVPVLLSASEKQLYLNMLSVKAVHTAFERETRTMDEYLFGPDGSVIRYRTGAWNKVRADLANALTDFGSLPHDLDAAWIKKRIHEGDLKPSVWVDSLAKNGFLYVVVGSALWGAPRSVTEFSLVRQAKLVTAVEPPCSEPHYSPVFADSVAAARHVHEHAAERVALSFGYILRDRWHDRFIATLPIEVPGSTLAYDQVFPDGLLPQGYVVDSLYLCAAPTLDVLPDDDYRHFFSPMDVHRALAQIQTERGWLPLYLSCSDGALLRFERDYYDPIEPPTEAAQSALSRHPFATLAQASADWRDVQHGTFSLPAYIGNMRKAGRLQVMVPSALWGIGFLARDWQPHKAGMSEQDLWSWMPKLALGPIFQHPDDAARYIQRRAGSAYEQVTTYESAILRQKDKHCFCALEPLARGDDTNHVLDRIFRTSSDPTTTQRNKPPIFPAGYELIASHQLYLSGTGTLAMDAEQVYFNFASPWFVYLHTHALKDKGFKISSYYYSTPHGALIKYVPEYTHAEKTLLKTKQVERVGDRWITRLSTADFITQLAEIGELRVLTAAHYWNQSGRLGSHWKTDRQQVPLAPVSFRRDEL